MPLPARGMRAVLECIAGHKRNLRIDALAAATLLSFLPKLHSASVFRRFLDMVDDEDLSRCLGGVQLEPDLLLNGGIQVGWRVGAVCWGRSLGCHAGELRVVGRPLEGEVEPSCESSLIEHRAVEHSLLHQPDEVSHICVGPMQITQRMEEQPRETIWIPFALGKLWARLGSGQHINRKLFLVVVKGKLVALDKQLLQHAFPLFLPGAPSPLGFWVISDFTFPAQSGAPMTCLAWTP